jgi:hypothetical protein
MQHVKQNVLIADDLALQSALRGETKWLYTGIWDHLDTAAAQTYNAGRSTEAYAAVRSIQVHDLDAVREAIAALKAAWPEIDWAPRPDIKRS